MKNNIKIVVLASAFIVFLFLFVFSYTFLFQGNFIDYKLSSNAIPKITGFDTLTPSEITQIIPAARLENWTPGVTTGVRGGIPTRTVICTTIDASTYGNGLTDATSTIQNAINNCPANEVIYIPAGNYKVTSGITIGPNKDNITLRGDGENTIITIAGGTGFYAGSSSDYMWDYPNSGNNISSGLTRGSTQLGIGDPSSFSAGQIAQISIENDPSIPVISTLDYPNMRRQMVLITGKTANSLSIWPPIYDNYDSLSATIHVAQQQTDFVGFEDMSINITNQNTQNGIYFEQTYGSWIKNVKISNANNYDVFFSDSLNCELRHSYLDALNHAGSNGAGLLFNSNSGCLVEDNIIYKSFPNIEVNNGSSGNVFAYNFLEDSTSYGVEGASIDTNHGPHNQFNLYEGNIAPNIEAEGYFGSVSSDTIFRNWLHGTEPGVSDGGWSMTLKRFTRDYSVVGNIFGRTGYSTSDAGVAYGQPNIGNGFSNGTAPPWTDAYSDSFRLGEGLTQTDHEVTVISPMFVPSDADTDNYRYIFVQGFIEPIDTYIDSQNVTVKSSADPHDFNNVSYEIVPGSSGWQELDLGVLDSSIVKGNYYSFYTSIPSNESLGSDVLPNSAYLSAKPLWFGNLSWPPFDPSNPNMNFSAIPAGYRFLYGIDVPNSSVPSYNLSVSKLGNGTGKISGNGLNCGSTCYVMLNNNTAVTLTATPSTGSNFTGWSGTECAGINTCKFNITANVSVIASFTKLPSVPVVVNDSDFIGGDTPTINDPTGSLIQDTQENALNDSSSSSTQDNTTDETDSTQTIGEDVATTQNSQMSAVVMYSLEGGIGIVIAVIVAVLIATFIVRRRRQQVALKKHRPLRK